MRRLHRIGRAQERTSRDIEILSEALGTWVEIWFAHTPGVADHLKHMARRSAQGRYAQFLEYVSRRLSGPHRFIDDLPKEPIADEAGLTRVAGESESPPKSQDGSER